MENSERIKKWKEERAKVAEESRASRLQQKENERSLRQTEKTADAKSHHRPDAGWSATDADSVRRASLVIKERRVQQAKQSLRRLFLYIALPLLVIMLMSWLLTSRFYSADATLLCKLMPARIIFLEQLSLVQAMRCRRAFRFASLYFRKK